MIQGDSRNLSEIVDKYNSLLYNDSHETNNTKTIKQRNLQIVPRGPLTSRNSRDGRNLSGADSKATERSGISMQRFRNGSQTGLQDRAAQARASSGEASRKLQAWQKQCGISDGNSQREMLELRSDGELRNSSQERQPLRQRPEESGSPVRILPHEHHEEEVVGCKESRVADTEKQCSDGVETQVSLILSSPPYAESMSSEKSGIDWSKCKRENGTPRDMSKEPAHKTRIGAGGEMRYGKSKENLGNLKSGDVDCVISSPPWEETNSKFSSNTGARQAIGNWADKEVSYGKTEGQIGNQQGDTFWAAAKTILEQCHQILKPGGHAIWVVKSFVRNKKIVDFPGDWKRLCESVGFVTLCEHHAMLVKETSHKTLFGHTEVKRKERKSFFRRLAESKGSPRIDYEVVLCMERPIGSI